MDKLELLLARHPIDKKPYNAIHLVQCDYFGTPIYRVTGDARQGGAAKALKIAFEKYGAHCFHSGNWMPAQPLSTKCTRDHVRARANQGSNYRHNLVFACGKCNSTKGRDDIVSFNEERGAEYLRALDAHLGRCIAEMSRMAGAVPARRRLPSSPQPPIST